MMRVSLRLSDGTWGHGQGATTKQAKRAALENARSKPVKPQTLLWLPDSGKRGEND